MSDREDSSGPVPVRDLMRASQPAPPPEAEGTPRWEGDERRFEDGDVAWIVRPAGAGAYGTGDTGTARILAVHFYREGADRPEREALIAAERFPYLAPGELVALLAGATPIVEDPDRASG